MKTVFFSGPFTHDFDKEIIKEMREWISSLGFEVIVPHYFAEEAPDKIHESVRRNFSFVDRSDIILADVNRPSHGVGMEVFHGYKTGKKVILIARDGVKFSDMITVHAHDIIKYKDFTDLKEKLGKTLKN